MEDEEGAGGGDEDGEEERGEELPQGGWKQTSESFVIQDSDLSDAESEISYVHFAKIQSEVFFSFKQRAFFGLKANTGDDEEI